MNEAPFLNATLAAVERYHEQRYHVPIPEVDAYELINTAIWYTLARLAPGYNCIANATNASTCYYIQAKQITVQLFVIRLTPSVAIVRVFPLLPADPIEGILWRHANHEAMSDVIGDIYARCDQEARRFIRDAADAAQYTTPDPPKELDSFLRWLIVWHPEKSYEEAAAIAPFQVKEKTLRNRASELGITKIRRGRRKVGDISGH